MEWKFLSIRRFSEAVVDKCTINHIFDDRICFAGASLMFRKLSSKSGDCVDHWYNKNGAFSSLIGSGTEIYNNIPNTAHMGYIRTRLETDPPKENCYLVWTTITDAPITNEMTNDDFTAWLKENTVAYGISQNEWGKRQIGTLLGK